MLLGSGSRLGTYDIVAMLGEGGMGEVYRARDTKLGREVAIKILPEGFAHDPDRVVRFQREAQLLAALNHPHIAAIHGLEESEATRFLVLELVDGKSLAEKLASGSGLRALGRERTGPGAQSPQPKAGGLPVSDALKIARQIADALEAAHEKGIIHATGFGLRASGFSFESCSTSAPFDDVRGRRQRRAADLALKSIPLGGWKRRRCAVNSNDQGVGDVEHTQLLMIAAYAGARSCKPRAGSSGTVWRSL